MTISKPVFQILQERLKNDPTAEKSRVISQLILEMELQSFELSKSLEGIISRITLDIPKISDKVIDQRNEIGNFKSVLDNARKSVKNQQVKSSSLDSLFQLDCANERVKAVQLCLKDADNWSTVSAEMDALFVALDHRRAVARLADAEKSLQVLKSDESSAEINIDDREQLLQDLRIKFRTILCSELKNSLLQEQVSKLIIECLDDIGFSDDSRVIIHEYLRADLFKNWPTLYQHSISSTNPMKMYFEGLLEVVNRRCFPLLAEIFGESLDELHKMMAIHFQSASPSFDDILSSFDRNGKEDAIILIVDAYSSCNNFGLDFENLFKIESNALDWGKTIFDSFLPFQKQFESLEMRYLNHQIQKEKLFDPSRLLTFLSIAESSLARFLDFTFGCVKLNFDDMMENFLTQVIEKGVIHAQHEKSIKGNDPEIGFRVAVEQLKRCITFHHGLGPFLLSIQERAKNADRVTPCKSSSRALKTLRRDFHVSESHNHSKSIENSIKLIKRWQTIALDSLLIPVDVALDKLCENQLWTNEKSGNDLQFSFSPLPHITSIGEYMLTLPQKFDPFSQDEALSFSLKSLPYVTEDLFTLENDESNLSYEATHIWIISAVRLIESKYVEAILKISSLSSHGLRQLCADATYLKNVMAAIEIDPQEIFRDIIYAIHLSDSELVEEIGRESIHDLDLLKRVAKMRSSPSI